MPKRRLFLNVFFIKVYIFVFLSSSIFSQEYSYRHYTVKDGLVQNQVITMYKDSRGYLWLGTKGGVSRFDGMEFVNFTINDGLLSNHIIRIMEDSEGGIIISSYIGVSRILNGKIETLVVNDTLNTESNWTLIPRFTKSDFCIINNSQVLTYIAPYDSAQINYLSGLNDIEISFITREDISGKYFIRSNDGTLYWAKNDTIVPFDDSIKASIIKDKSGRIYCFDAESVYILDSVGNQMKKYFCPNMAGVAALYDFDNYNNVYLGLDNKNILVFDGHKAKKSVKKFNYINSILSDTENNLWIATETGFFRKISDAFENFTTETGTNEYVWSIVEDNLHNIWLASYGDGLMIWDGQKHTRIYNHVKTYNDQQGNYFYTGAILANNGHLYFPVKQRGVLQYDGNDFSLIEGLPHGSVLDAYEDSLNKKILFSSTRGLVVLEGYKTPVIYDRSFNDTKKYIKTIAQDKFGRYWLGGEFMLTIFDGKDFIEFPNEEFDYNAGAISIYLDQKENLWLGTTSGLYFFDYSEFRKVGANILKSQVASFTERDSILYMGVGEGLAILNLRKFYIDSMETITILDDARGFLGFDCIRNGILKDSDDNIWIAASDRVVKFYPDKLEKDTIKPIVRLQQFTARGSQPENIQNYDLHNYVDKIIKLPYYLINFRIDFHAIHYIAPEKIKYSYILVGNDEGWSLPSKERFVSYTNLNPGKYTFEVKAQNIDGVWSKSPAIVSFEIVPAFWQTFTFKLIVNFLILLLILLIIFLVWNFRRKRKQRIKETEKQISELQLKTIRSQMDPHFTFNALNSISSFIYKEDKEKAYRYFTKFSKLVRSSLEASDKITRTLEEEIEFTTNYLDLEKIRFNDQFNYSINITNSVKMDTLVPKMIIHNYAENSVKHGLKHRVDNRKLNIDISLEDSFLKIMIEDNGVGRQKAKDIDEFSTGKGLKIMSNIYDLYFNLYKVRIRHDIEDLMDEEGNGTGTRVILRIPIKF